MSRLLFAAARGARVQRQQEAMPPSRRVWWEDVAIQWGLDDELRIHPEDEHLQYGPISTALRDPDDCHETAGRYPALALHASVAAGLSWAWAYNWDHEPDEFTRSLFLLILSEALADEGL